MCNRSNSVKHLVAMGVCGLLLALSGQFQSAQAQQSANLAMYVGTGCKLRDSGRFQFYMDGHRLDGPGSFSVHESGQPASLENRTYRFTVPAGFYHYSASITPTDGSEQACAMNYYVAVMPGDVRLHNVPLAVGTGDPLTPMLVAGAKPPDVVVTLERAADNLKCNSKPQLQYLKRIETVNDRGAYYSEGNVWNDEQNAFPFILEIQRSPDDIRMLRIALERPKEPISGDATFLRLDLTPALLSRIFQNRSDTVLCL